MSYMQKREGVKKILIIQRFNIDKFYTLEKENKNEYGIF